jgi:hypothetical protein
MVYRRCTAKDLTINKNLDSILRIDESIDTRCNNPSLLKILHIDHIRHKRENQHPLILPTIPKTIFRQKYETTPMNPVAISRVLKSPLPTPDSFKLETYSPFGVVSKFGIYFKSKFVSSPRPWVLSSTMTRYKILQSACAVRMTPI